MPRKHSSHHFFTPIFSLQQTSDTLTLTIRCPYSRSHDISVSAIQQDFTFQCTPYLLTIRFSHPVEVADLHQPSTYHFPTGLATVALQKLVKVPFEDVEFLTNSLEPNHRQSHPLMHTTKRSIISINQQFSATVPVAHLDIPLQELSLTRPTYGFAARYEAVFSLRQEDVSQIVLLPSPDSTPVWRRRAIRRAAEDVKFDPNHYIADYLLRADYFHALQYTPRDRLPVNAPPQLPDRNYPSDVDWRVACDLCAILYASAYDERTTAGERNVESAWTISRLAPCMAYLEIMKSPHDAVLAAYRASLIYPLYRATEIADLVLKDLNALFLGNTEKIRSALFNILLELKDIFEDHPLLRLHNDLFLIDYCIWIQAVDKQLLERLALEIASITIERNELEINLNSFEYRAQMMAKHDDQIESTIDAPLPTDHKHPDISQNTSHVDNIATADASDPPLNPTSPRRTIMNKLKYGPASSSSPGSSSYYYESCSSSTSEGIPHGLVGTFIVPARR